MKRLWNRLTTWWLAQRCQAQLRQPGFEGWACPGEGVAAGRLGKGFASTQKGAVLVCSRRPIDCERCPRFEAVRQAFGISHLQRRQDEDLAAYGGQTDLGNGYGLAAQIDNFEAKARPTPIIEPRLWGDPQADEIALPIAPEAEQAKDRTEACQAEGDLLRKGHRGETLIGSRPPVNAGGAR